jgi:hypothetical protein
LTLSAALTKSSLGMNSYSNFMPSFLLLVEGESETGAALVPPGRPAAPHARPAPEVRVRLEIPILSLNPGEKQRCVAPDA